MKSKNLITLCALALMFAGTNASAQSLKDLLNKTTIEKTVSTITGKNINVQLEGTWVYQGSAVDFESDNLLKKAGGEATSAIVQNKMDEQLAKVGIKPGMLSYTFKADSTFTTTIAGKSMPGTYSYDASTKILKLKYAKLLNIDATINYTSTETELLFKSDKLLKLIVFLTKKSGNSTLNSISSVAESYDGMNVGFNLKKQ